LWGRQGLVEPNSAAGLVALAAGAAEQLSQIGLGELRRLGGGWCGGQDRQRIRAGELGPNAPRAPG
jgi:hypothetical protein